MQMWMDLDEFGTHLTKLELIEMLILLAAYCIVQDLLM
jgi:hypothetical protein